MNILEATGIRRARQSTTDDNGSKKNFYDISKSRSNNPYCAKCKGSCIREDAMKTREAVLKLFGIIPNSCIPSSDGKTLCPYSGKNAIT